MVEMVLDSKALLAEGPCWDDNRKLLYWVDIIGKKLHIFNPIRKTDHTIELDQHVSAVVLKDNDHLLLTLQHGFYSLDLATNNLKSIHELEMGLTKNRFNDGKCDPTGRFWAGTMDMEEEKPTGSLYYLDTDFSVKKAISNVTVSNGLAWSPDLTAMYYIDTPTKEVAAFDFDRVSGSISNRRVAIKFPEKDGYPDGMTIDEEGMIWIAHWGGSKISRWNPKNGKCLEQIEIPATLVTSCTFGGENLNELYITTARTSLSDSQLEKEPHAGGIFKLITNVKGVPSYRFKYSC